MIPALLGLVFGGCGEREPAELTNQMDAPEQFWVRVLLRKDIGQFRFTPAWSFTVINEGAARFEAHFEQQRSPMEVHLSDGAIMVGSHRFPGGEVVILPDAPHIVNVGGSEYRGKLRLILGGDGESFDVINEVPLEPYLAGVVGAEMPSYWEGEALAAQATAARTYCLYIKKRFGATRSWDVTANQSHQVYRGLSAESSSVWDAVRKTWGQILECADSQGEQGIFPTYYSSACGGHTEDSSNVFGDSFESLTGVRCSYCRQVAKPKLFFWEKIEYDKAEAHRRLAGHYPGLLRLGEIVGIVAERQSDYSYGGEAFSRVTKVRLLGSNGKSDFVRGEDFRLALDPSGAKFKSAIFRIFEMKNNWVFLSGRGWGHGVGMCQCGAEGMARRGKKANEILSYYYPGSRIVDVYGKQQL